MKQKKWMAALSAAALLFTLTACRASVPESRQDATTSQPEETTAPETTVPETTTPQTTVPETTEPVETTESPVSDPAVADTEPQTVRVQDISQSRVEQLIAQYPSPVKGGLPMLQADSAEDLEALLNSIGSDVLRDAVQGYDSAFFQEYTVLLVPRVTTTGSARHTVELVSTADSLVAEVTVTTPEIATMDMANWILVIPVPRADATGKTVFVRIADGMGGLRIPGFDNTQPTGGLVTR